MSTYDTVIVGSGFGGAMVAHELVGAGQRVLMIERGDWVHRGPHNWAPEAVGPLTPHYSTETPYRALAGGEREIVGSFNCVGGPSVFYGGASLRFRAEDFDLDPEIAGDSGAAWPYRYSDLEAYYSHAERIIGVAGETGSDPIEPFRSAPYPHPPGALTPTSRRVRQAARSLGLRPFRIPLAFNHARRDGRAPCAACGTCDGFACAIGAKNDLATAVLPELIRRGLTLAANTVAVRLVSDDLRVRAVECVERNGGRRVLYEAARFVLAAGALASPHLILASSLEPLNPAGHVVGRFLMRHFNAVVVGVFPRRPDPHEQFHKQIGIHDYYFGHPSVTSPPGKLGGIQQMGTPPAALVKAYLPGPLGVAAATVLPHVTGLLVIAEDQPRFENRVEIDPRSADRFGLPELRITHRYTPRDRAAGRALIGRARQVLRRAGAWATYVQPIRTFSHALGTVRMGLEPGSSPLDGDCRFRGVDNLYVVDGSCLPTSAGVNPSLTIAANALRVGARLALLGSVADEDARAMVTPASGRVRLEAR